MEYFNSNLELKEFSKNLHSIVLPSSLWAVHTDPEYHFIAILHLQVRSLSKLNIDKGVLVTFNSISNLINTSLFIQNELVYLPALNNTIKSASDLSHLIYVMHNLKLCPNVDKNLEYPRCCKYVDFGKFEIFCQSCLCSDKNDRSRNNLWKNVQDIQYPHSLLSDETVVDNLIEENNLCCSENDNNQIIVAKKIDFNNLGIMPNSENIKSQENDFRQSSKRKIGKSKSDRRCFSCELCNRTFLTKGHLQEHLRSHTGEKPFLCEICNKASSRRSVHQRHVLTHSNVKPNLCNVCGKTFCQGYRMKDHLLTHSSERPYECETCHKVFAKNYNLKLHQKIHSGSRPFVCSACGKTYTTQSNLSTHIRSTHTNKKPHVCTNCHMSFVHPRHLRIHMRKHTGEKPYKCIICAKTFAKNIHLTIHMRTHTGEKPHTCTICGKGFTTTGNLSSHKRVHHKDLNINVIT